MRIVFLLLLGLGTALNTSSAQLASVVPANADPQTLPTGVKAGMIRYVSQPNGWGRTKEDALKDLHNRIFPWYERNFGQKPGFQIDWNWVAYVEVSHKRCWQADGRLWWYVHAATSRSNERDARTGRFHSNR
ncbi:MAG: hypothetical protein H7Y17_10640 [Chlorobia bacterium]|nr:hypothetical protein [Fimbriimonadaceae bacterium]